jgi:hypothetical protein
MPSKRPANFLPALMARSLTVGSLPIASPVRTIRVPVRATAAIRLPSAAAPTPRMAAPAPLVPTIAVTMLKVALPPARAGSLDQSSRAIRPLPA